MLVKICGITNGDDAQLALDAGADYIGLNMVGGPRRIDPAAAVRVVAALPDPQRVVALLSTDGATDPPGLAPMKDCGVRLFQLYGPAAASGPFPWLGPESAAVFVQAVSGPESLDAIDAVLTRDPAATPRFVLLDAHSPGKLGGTGMKADWTMLGEARRAGRFDHWPEVLLAGGLTPDNVREAIALVEPAGVDVSSGVESSPGRKDPVKVCAFIANART